jgi:isoleucyl-tRNA synthetase
MYGRNQRDTVTGIFVLGCYAIEEREKDLKIIILIKWQKPFTTFYFQNLNLATFISNTLKKTFFMKRQTSITLNGNKIRSILFTCISNGFLLMAPMMPFHSEELYQELTKQLNDSRSIFQCMQVQ